MRIETKKGPFKEIKLIIETQEELNILHGIGLTNVSVPDGVSINCSNLMKNEIKDFCNKLDQLLSSY